MANFENNITLPNHLKVEFCRMLDRKDGAYGVVLCELFPPQKDKKVHQLVFKYETKKSKLTIEKWKKIFQKCNILDDFYEAVRKHAGQEPWIEESGEDDFATDFSHMHILKNPIGIYRGNNASDDYIKEQLQTQPSLEINQAVHERASSQPESLVAQQQADIGRLQTDLSLETDQSRLREREISRLLSVLTQVQADKEQLASQIEQYESLLMVQSQRNEDPEIRNILQEIVKIRNAVLFWFLTSKRLSYLYLPCNRMKIITSAVRYLMFLPFNQETFFRSKGTRLIYHTM